MGTFMNNVKRIKISIFERVTTAGYCTDTFDFEEGRIKYEEKPEVQNYYDDPIRWSRSTKKLDWYEAKYNELKTFVSVYKPVDIDISSESRIFSITIKDNDNKVIKRFDLECLSKDGQKLYDLLYSMISQIELADMMNFFFAASTKCGEFM